MMRIICIIVFLQLVSSQRHQNVELEETITTGGCSISVLKERGRNLRHDSRNTGYMSSGGVRNPPGTHPWEVSVGLDDWRGEWAHYCGGVIVSSNHVVTSANCLEEMLYEGMSITDIHIRAGDDHLKIEPDSFSVQEIRIRKYTNHPEFYSDGDFNYYKNIAVIELEESLRFQDVFVRAIYLPTLEESDTATKHSDTDVSLVIAGRGSWTSQNGRRHSLGGALTDGIIVSFNDIYCSSVYNGSMLSHGFTEDVMCGGGPLDLAGVCYGDDGSGVFKLDHEKERFVLVGILSLGSQYEDELNCGHKNKPNIFIRISSRSIINFLYETIYGSSCKNLNVENTDVLPNLEVSQYLYEDCGLNMVIEDGYHGVDKNSVWPWLVSLRREMEDPDDHSKVWSHLCWGTILSRTKILAAAQCLGHFKYTNAAIKIRAGDVVVTYNNDDDNVQERLVKNFTIHPKHSSNSYFDVAVLDLEIPLTFTFNSVKPICLLSLEEAKHITKEDETYLPLSVPVLGYTWGGGNRNILATVFSEETCNRSHPLEKDYRYLVPNLFSEDTLCAGDIAGDQGSCYGDSGAGAVHFDQHRNRFVLRATLSGSAHGICGSFHFPNVYVRMANKDVLEWIFNNIGFISPKAVSLENKGSIQMASTLVCTTSASRPPSSIKWIITDIGKNIVTHQKSQENITEVPEGFITISSMEVTTKHNFKVECEAENIVGKQTSKAIHTQGVIPPKSVSLENEGSVQMSLELVCKTSASRPPSSINWIITNIDKSTVKIKKTQENITEVPEGFITISSMDVTEKLNLKVECEAENIVGKQISNAIHTQASLRLIGGSKLSEGNVYYKGKPVCDDGWGSSDGKVVCRELGFSGFLRVSQKSYFGSVPAEFSMDQVKCTGIEARLEDCAHDTSEDCGPTEGAGVVCVV